MNYYLELRKLFYENASEGKLNKWWAEKWLWCDDKIALKHFQQVSKAYVVCRKITSLAHYSSNNVFYLDIIDGAVIAEYLPFEVATGS